MKRDIALWSWIGFAFTSLAGTLLHFLYEWSGGKAWVALFSGVNESTWEHMKLLYFPLLVFGIVQWFFFRENSRFWLIKWMGTSVGLTLIPVLYYTYNGVFGKSPDWVNISIFFVSAAVAFCLENRLFQKEKAAEFSGFYPFLWIVLIGVLFVIFTFFPPHIPLFQDPITGRYGR